MAEIEDREPGTKAVSVADALMARVDDGVKRMRGLKQHSGDPETCHMLADELLLEFASPKIREAYEDLRRRVGFTCS